jgi:hypothetical protein
MNGLDRRGFLRQAGGTALLSCAPAWVNSSSAEVLPVEAAQGREPAAIFWKSGAGPGQVAVLAGHGLKEASISIARHPDGIAPDAADPNLTELGAELRWEHAHLIEQENSYAYVEIPEQADGGVLTFANVIRENRLHDRAKIVLLYYSESPFLERIGAVRALRGRPWSVATVIEDNSVTDAPVGIDIAAGFEGVLLRNNRFLRVEREIRRAAGRLPKES